MAGTTATASGDQRLLQRLAEKPAAYTTFHSPRWRKLLTEVDRSCDTTEGIRRSKQLNIIGLQKAYLVRIHLPPSHSLKCRESVFLWS